MSEKVQLALERFLPELRDLEQRKLFSKGEINDIVAKRRGFEISLANGRNTKPLDYVRYIEYEQKLEKLRRARTIRLQLTSTKSRSDYSIQYHITQLHRLSVRRFPESLPLWDAYIAHALAQDSPQLVSRTLSAAISMHPMTTRFWIMASRWESEGDEKGMGGGNTEGARRLCMRALRFLKKRKRTGTRRDEGIEGGDEDMDGQQGDEELVWKEWIRLEVAFVEKLRSRQRVLGLGQRQDGAEVVVRVAEKRAAGTGSEALEAEEEVVEIPTLEGEDVDQDQVQQDVDQKVLSGQEAILDGAIVRAVLDNFLKSYHHSLPSYRCLLSTLRTLPSSLRLSLLTHVYHSLDITRLQDPTHPSYSGFFHLYATRHLYDVPYSPPKSSKKRTTDDTEVLDPVDPDVIKVQGERLVDAVGKVTRDYWRVLKAPVRKTKTESSKGKRKALGTGRGMQRVWEQFASWLAEIATETQDADLLAFLDGNLATVFNLAPPSPPVALARLGLLVRTSSSPSDITSFASEMTRVHGGVQVPPAIREQIWVARIETCVLVAPSPPEVNSLLDEVLKALPFSSKLWNLSAEFSEQTLPSPSLVSRWYSASIQRTLLTDASPPATFTTSFEEFVDVLPRELLPRKFVHYLSTTAPALLEPTLLDLLDRAPTLSLGFLNDVLHLSTSASTRHFRNALHEKITAHPEARAQEWVDYAKELMQAGGGQVLQGQEVLRRAKGRLAAARGSGEVERFEQLWQEACSAIEE